MKPAAVLRAIQGVIFLSITSVAAQNGSALLCKPYIPIGAGYDKPMGSLEFAGDFSSEFGYPGNPMITKGSNIEYRQGKVYTFFARSCNSTSLALQRHRDEDGGCNVDYIQIINTVTGHCMTWEKYPKASNVSFAPCVHTPNTPAQLFSATQCDEFPGDPEIETTTGVPFYLRYSVSPSRVEIEEVNGHDGTGAVAGPIYHPTNST
ncbi:hypothetical protein MMC10_007842 [Thelotrema lepadinum]|nr:hypothetical protein [Thelotrema lepadinum]